MIISLKKYINNWLDTYKVKDIFTGELQTAREIFNWDKSYFLKLLIQDKYYIDTDIDFVTKNPNYIKIIKKPLSQISPKKVKKYRTITKLVPQTVYEDVIDYVPITTRKYRLVNDYDNPIYKTVIKKRKIGKKYYITTEYIPTGKYRKIRQYYDDIEYVERVRTKKRTVYVEKEYKEPYYEQVRERTESDIKTQITEYRYFEPFFVFEFYKTFDDGYEHYLYIAPMFSGKGNAIVLFSDDTEIVNNEETGVFIQPKEFVKQSDYNNAVRKTRFMILNGKKNIEPQVFRQARQKIEKNQELHTLYLEGTYNRSLDVLKMLFFRPAQFDNNIRTRII